MQNIMLYGLVLLLMFHQTCRADSLRCQTKLVRPGDTTIEVKLKCGQPFEIEQAGKIRTKKQTVEIERYVYMQAKGTFVKVLEFHNGILQKISNGPRVE